MALTAQEIGTMTAAEIASKVRSKALSAAEVTEAALARLDAFEPHIHAFSAKGHELARTMAKAIDDTIGSRRARDRRGGKRCSVLLCTTS